MMYRCLSDLERSINERALQDIQANQFKEQVDNQVQETLEGFSGA